MDCCGGILSYGVHVSEEVNQTQTPSHVTFLNGDLNTVFGNGDLNISSVGCCSCECSVSVCDVMRTVASSPPRWTDGEAQMGR